MPQLPRTETYPAVTPPVRLSRQELEASIARISGHQILDALLTASSGLLAILNDRRQVVAVNEAFFRSLGITDPGDLLGLRPGEALRCIRAKQSPNGCGTSEYCPTCGAAIAIVSATATHGPVEKTCALQVQDSNGVKDLYFRVRAVPLTFDSVTLLLLFLQDITRQQELSALERAFRHDLANLIAGLAGMAELLQLDPERSREERVADLLSLAHRLSSEIQHQRLLSGQTDIEGRLILQTVHPTQIVQDLQALFRSHPQAQNRTIQCVVAPDCTPLQTDQAGLLRVLGNMLTNALEATDDGGGIRLSVRKTDSATEFSVWNRSAIEPQVAKRIFQRNFSTKGDIGRGLGTYSMKMITEKRLGGQIGFDSSPAAGTTFWILLPATTVTSPPTAPQT